MKKLYVIHTLNFILCNLFSIFLIGINLAFFSLFPQDISRRQSHTYNAFDTIIF